MRALLALLLLIYAVPAKAERIKDLARISGVRANQLVGYGLVVGLAGTGDDNLGYTVQGLKSAVSRLGLSLPPGLNPAAKNAAAVMLTAELPPFAKPGQRLDITVSAIGKAKSLRGGTLLYALLQGADGAVYASAQGSVAIGGLGVEGADGSSLTVNVPSAGRIPQGGIVERDVPTSFATGDTLRLDLNAADYTTAQRIADAINESFGHGTAAPLDGASVTVRAPANPARRVALLSRIENIDLAPGKPTARIVINARTGTIVIGADVRLHPVAVAHGRLTVRVTEAQNVSQPAPFSRGETRVTPESTLDAAEDRARVSLFNPGAKLRDLVDALNALGATPSDLVAILEAIHQAGAMHAELVVL